MWTLPKENLPWDIFPEEKTGSMGPFKQSNQCFHRPIPDCLMSSWLLEPYSNFFNLFKYFTRKPEQCQARWITPTTPAEQARSIPDCLLRPDKSWSDWPHEPTVTCPYHCRWFDLVLISFLMYSYCIFAQDFSNLI